MDGHVTFPNNYSALSTPRKPKKLKRVGGLLSRCRKHLPQLLALLLSVTVVYIMMEYRCQNNNAKRNINELSKNIENIASNLSMIRNKYQELEGKIMDYNKDLPKIESQLEVLEKFASKLDKNYYNYYNWGKPSLVCLPNVDVVLRDAGKNSTSTNSTS